MGKPEWTFWLTRYMMCKASRRWRSHCLIEDSVSQRPDVVLRPTRGHLRVSYSTWCSCPTSVNLEAWLWAWVPPWALSSEPQLFSLFPMLQGIKEWCWFSELTSMAFDPIPIFSSQVALCVCVPNLFSHVQLLATLETVAHQAPLSMGFSS